VLADELISSITTTVAGQAAQAAVDGGKKALAALVGAIRERPGRDRQGLAALEATDRNPQDESALSDLTQALKRLTLADADFAARVRELWPQAMAELSASSDSVINSVTGRVQGHLTRKEFT
jgi:hypothetical protein